ncbi:BglG family transcription antiterminator [Maledivibacter halophilus]|uniref:Transcriptional antiterminator n=1 Tax=Maledivibacter halophilus TaxID=36842 RepID=A0A1T5L0L9_9FIRM|nr:PTS sugar transporter subunit IIA [Maledivibacter halophilus]SKC69511.1 Transcriptional antiterminator [Maledivibacter halophilus]
MKIKRRKYQLIEMLCQEREYKPMSYYARKLDVSSRTISNDLNDLDGIFKKYDLILEKRPNYGVLLKGKEANFKHLITNFYDNGNIDSLKERYKRQAEIIREIILYGKVVTYQDLSDKLYINSSVIYQDMENLKRFQNSYCQIISDRNGTRVKGTEYGKQKLLKQFFNCYINKCYPNASIEVVSDVLSSYYPNSVIAVVTDILDSLSDILKRLLEEYYLNSLFIFLVTIASRKKSGRELIVDFEILNQEGIELLSNYHLAVEISNQFKKRLGIQFVKNEIDYISYQLFMHRVELSINNKYLENMFSKDIKYFINSISKSLGLNLTNDQQLYDALICHMVPMIYRVRSNVSIENPILNQVKNNYPVLFNLSWFHLNEISNKFHIFLSEDEVSFITIHLQVAIERASSRGHVIVVCKTGLLTSELLVNRIRKSLPSSVEVNVIPLNELNEENTKNVDFIISTVQLENSYKPYIKVSPLVDDEELREVYDYYLKYSKGEIRRLNHSKQKIMKLIPSLMNLKHIYMENDFKTKEECLDYLFQNLYEDDCVDKKFRDDIYERESLGSTYLSLGVSFPHAMPTYVRKSAISVLLLPNGVFWDEHRVYLVIMLAIKSDEIKETIKDLPVLYKKVLDYQFINNLVRLNEPEDIKKMLLE